MVRTAIIGAGGISHAHIEALNRIENVKVIAVLDVNRERAEKLAARCGAKVCERMEEFLGQVDMVHILTPPSKRKEYAIKAMKAGKHVVAEKPISISIEDAEEMIKTAKECGVKLMVAFNHRFRPGYKLLQDAVKSGQLGDVINFWSYRLGTGAGFGKQKMSKSWRTDPNLVCGMSIESLSHDIDMMRGLVGEVSDVRANTLGTIQELPEFDNNANVVFTLANGGTGLIHASWSSHISLSARGVIGTKGTAVIQGPDLWEFTQFRIKTEDMEYEKTLAVNDVFLGLKVNDQSYYEENKHFIDCVEKDLEPIVTGEDGLQALKISHAILKSHKEKIVVAL